MERHGDLLSQRVAVTLTHGDVWSCPGFGGAPATRPRRAPRSRRWRPKSSAPTNEIEIRMALGRAGHFGGRQAQRPIDHANLPGRPFLRDVRVRSLLVLVRDAGAVREPAGRARMATASAAKAITLNRTVFEPRTSPKSPPYRTQSSPTCPSSAEILLQHF